MPRRRQGRSRTARRQRAWHLGARRVLAPRSVGNRVSARLERVLGPRASWPREAPRASSRCRRAPSSGADSTRCCRPSRSVSLRS
ncbi:hypothetical protein ACFPRL_04010 [Pseudoclavibacter helvolus]